MIELAANECPFCHNVANRIIEVNEHAFSILDAFPVSSGHTLIVSRRHVCSYFDLEEKEIMAMFNLVHQAKNRLVKSHNSNAFNIGINIGSSAGQTIPHVHIHLIPRYPGDVDNPIGGVRNVIPGKAIY